MSRTFALLKIGVLLGVLAMAAACGGSDDGDAPGGETGSGEYGLRGQVLETTTNTPIAGLEVAIGSEALGWKAATTDAMGWWQVDGYDADSTRIWLKGRDLKSGAKRYPSVKTAIHDDWKQLDQLVTIPAQKYLPVVDAATSVDVSGNLVESTDAGHPASEGWKQFDPAGANVRVSNDHINTIDSESGAATTSWTYFDFAPGTFIKFPEGAEEIISVTQLPVDQLPHTLPETIFPDTMLASQPGGTEIDPPLQLHFGTGFLHGDVDEDAAETTVEAWTLLHSQATFVMVGDMEAADGDMGREVRTKEGEGLTELGWHGPGFRRRPQCNPTNFVAMLDRYSDEKHLPPANGTLTITGRNRQLNVGDKVETGRIAQCNGNFRFQYRDEDQDLPWVSDPIFGQLRPGGTLCLGTVTIDVKEKMVVVSRDGNACN